MRTYVADLALENVCEAMMAHTPKGIVGNYNLYKFERVKREGFELWHACLGGYLQQEPRGCDAVLIRGIAPQEVLFRWRSAQTVLNTTSCDRN
jgi:hypothetical protein